MFIFVSVYPRTQLTFFFGGFDLPFYGSNLSFWVLGVDILPDIGGAKELRSQGRYLA